MAKRSTPRRRFAEPATPAPDADNARAQIAAHGPGLTFGELAEGELFHWPGLPGPEPMVKASATRYEWSRGFGTAQAFYRVERACNDAIAPTAVKA
jgi:hypothetical protein